MKVESTPDFRYKQWNITCISWWNCESDQLLWHLNDAILYSGIIDEAIEIFKNVNKYLIMCGYHGYSNNIYILFLLHTGILVKSWSSLQVWSAHHRHDKTTSAKACLTRHILRVYSNDTLIVYLRRDMSTPGDKRRRLNDDTMLGRTAQHCIIAQPM